MKNKLSNKIFSIIGLISIILAVVFMLTTTASGNNSMVHHAIEYQKAAPLVGFVITLITLLGGIFVTVLSVIGKAHKYGWIESILLAALFIYF